MIRIHLQGLYWSNWYHHWHNIVPVRSLSQSLNAYSTLWVEHWGIPTARVLSLHTLGYIRMSPSLKVSTSPSSFLLHTPSLRWLLLLLTHFRTLLKATKSESLLDSASAFSHLPPSSLLRLVMLLLELLLLLLERLPLGRNLHPTWIMRMILWLEMWISYFNILPLMWNLPLMLVQITSPSTPYMTSWLPPSRSPSCHPTTLEVPLLMWVLLLVALWLTSASRSHILWTTSVVELPVASRVLEALSRWLWWSTSNC